MPHSYAVPTFLEKSLPVELVTALQDVIVAGPTVQLHCASNHYEPEIYNYYGTRCETTQRLPTCGRPALVQLDFCSDAIVRIRYAPGDAVAENHTPMVVGEFTGPDRLTIRREANGEVVMETAALRLHVLPEPWQLQIYNHAGDLLWRTRPADLSCLRRPEIQWNPAENRWLFYHRYAYPLGCAEHGDDRHAFLSFDLAHDEHIYGYGEGFGRLDKRQTLQRLWHVEGFGNASPGSYKNIPFFMSTRGYGLFIHTSHAVTAHVGNLEYTAHSLTVDDTSTLDLYFIYGPTLKEILPRYTAITGAPGLPPKWTFGLWMSRISYNRQEQVEQVAADLRHHRIPCDVIHIDTDWYERDWECDLEFGRAKFPDPAGMTARLRQQGFRITLWQWPNLIVGTRLFQEGRAKGMLVKRGNGHPYLFSGFEGDAGYIDYSNPAAVAWIQEKFRRLLRLGVAAIKVDFGEGAEVDACYTGAPAAAMHNLYPLLYNKAIFAVTEEVHGQGQAVVWARSAWAGSQRYPVHWSGDGLARYEDLACVLRSALSFGLSGFPFYSHDIGGFSGLPTPDLYVRWAQFGLFSSHARAHGVPPREPWAYGAEAEAIFRRYAELRYRLLPYIYSEAVRCARRSLPMLRPLVLDYQEDATTHTLEDQYLFGPDLLIAPILDERTRRRVYLPAGTWIEYWRKETLAGGRWIEVEAPLDTLPIFVRAGAILPYGPVVQHTAEQPYDPLTLELYAPGHSGEYVIHDEDRPDIRVAYQREGKQLRITTDPTPGQVEWVLFGQDVCAAEMAGTALMVTPQENGGARLTYDGRTARQITLTLADA